MRERKFVELMVETNNGARSAIISGYGSNLNVASNAAHRLLRRAKIRNAIEKRTAEVMAKLDLTPDRIVKRFAHFATHEPAEIRAPDVINALKELAKIARMYPAEQHEVAGPGGAPIAHMHAHAHKIDIASLEPEQRDQLRSVLLALKAQNGDEEPDGQ